VVVVSSLAQAGSQAALDALEAGAVDVLAKPDGTMSIGTLGERLAFHVKAAAQSARFRSRGPTPPPPAAPVIPAVAPAVKAADRQLIVIGGSTGGIEALRTLLPRFPAGMPPIAIVQHISPHFSRAVAERLDALSSLDVREAGQGDVLEPGTCVLAPGDAHLALEFSSGAYRTKLLKTPPIHHCRPAVDVLFRSAAEAGGDQVVAALLTGMGSDGAIGMGAIRAAGGATIAEHESTCVVYGMPRAAIEAGAAERVLPLPAIADAIIDAVSHRARRS
jgi:two-component system chemotaxis response regulator CheB